MHGYGLFQGFAITALRYRTKRYEAGREDVLKGTATYYKEMAIRKAGASLG